MHTALRAVALLIVAGALGGGLLIFATDNPESQLAGAALSNATTTMAFVLGSPVFEDGGMIPPLYTCDGMNTSPLLTIDGVPEDAQSLALIMDDPDVPKALKPDGVFDHWTLFNIDPKTTQIIASSTVGVPGVNGRGEQKYTGPCPPKEYQPSEHRYFFKMYALDTMLDLKAGATKAEVLAALEGHVLAETQLMGRYERKTK